MKKNYKYLIFFMLLVVVFTPIVMATGEGFDYENVCSTPNVLKAIKIIGNILKYGKWVALMAIIVFGVIDFTRAVTSDDEKALGKAGTALLKRFIAGVLVVLAPTILLAILNVFTSPSGYDDVQKNGSDFATCARCLLDTRNCSIKRIDPNYTNTEKSNDNSKQSENNNGKSGGTSIDSNGFSGKSGNVENNSGGTNNGKF